jgi:preprotein translocase subunit SecF
MKFKKNNYLSFIKPILSVCLAIVFVAGLLVAFYGFNYGFDITGGTQLVVDFTLSNVDIDNAEDFDTASSEVQEILTSNGVLVNSFQVQGDYGTKSFVVTFKKTSELNLQNIRLQINEQFNATENYQTYVDEDNEVAFLGTDYDLTRSTSTVESFIGSEEFVETVGAMLFALTIVMIYAFFRVKFGGALAIFFGGLFDVVMTLAFLAIVRIEINSYIFVVMALVLAYSIYSSADFGFNLKEKLKDQNFDDKTNSQLANMVVDENWKKNFAVAICSLVGLTVIGLLCYRNVMYVCLAGLVGVVVVFASHIFVVPAFYAFFAKPREIKPATKVKIQPKSSNGEAVVVDKPNYKDDNAKVIEIQG